MCCCCQACCECGYGGYGLRDRVPWVGLHCCSGWVHTVHCRQTYRHTPHLSLLSDVVAATSCPVSHPLYCHLIYHFKRFNWVCVSSSLCWKPSLDPPHCRGSYYCSGIPWACTAYIRTCPHTHTHTHTHVSTPSTLLILLPLLNQRVYHS